MHAKSRISRKKYGVESISLSDLLALHKAPQKIDYLSVDTEGSELEILSNFDFNISIDIITVEHNYHQSNRERIRLLLTSKGYERILEKFSSWDDWYVQRPLLTSGR
jgi:hypothetical protein